MLIIVNNTVSEVITGGRDNLVDPDLLRHIRNYMSINVPGAYFAEAYQKRHWDGKKYFFTPKGQFATGFLPMVYKFVSSEYPAIDIVIRDERDNPVSFKSPMVTQIGDYSLVGDYQHQADMIALYNNTLELGEYKLPWLRGIVDAATNAGKTTIFAGIYANLEDSSMLLLIHRKGIYKQLVEFFTRIFGEVGEINDKKYDIKPLTIAMAPTLSNRVKNSVKVRNDIYAFNVLAVDESHRAGSKTYLSIFKYVNAYARVFMSGTSLDSDDQASKLWTIGHSGMKLGGVSKVELMNKGISTPVQVKMYLANTPLYGNIEDYNYEDYLNACIFNSVTRIGIMNLICKGAKGSVLIAVDFINHGQSIYEQLRVDYPNIHITHGEDPMQLQKVDDFREGKFRILISTGILKEGINIPGISDLIYAPGGKSKIGIKQWMGRIERLYNGKDQATFHDFYDIGPYVRSHSEKRMSLYVQEGIPMLCNFNLKDARKLTTIIV